MKNPKRYGKWKIRKRMANEKSEKEGSERSKKRQGKKHPK